MRSLVEVECPKMSRRQQQKPEILRGRTPPAIMGLGHDPASPAGHAGKLVTHQGVGAEPNTNFLKEISNEEKFEFQNFFDHENNKFR